jgi:hypothetical protein
MEFDYFTRQRLEGKMLLIADRKKYEEPLTEKEKSIMDLFYWLNTKNEVEHNIELFFELLGGLIDFEKGGGKA